MRSIDYAVDRTFGAIGEFGDSHIWIGGRIYAVRERVSGFVDITVIIEIVGRCKIRSAVNRDNCFFVRVFSERS